MATKNDTPIDKDKETLMEVRGIIDGCIESGSKDYKAAIMQVLETVVPYQEYSLGKPM